jgi:hypothetical protein
LIRLFNVYYPIRTLVLLGGEAVLVWMSFLVAAVWQHPEDSYVMLNYEGGYLKILFATVAVLVFSHLFDLYEPAHWNARGELYFRLLLVPGVLALAIAAPTMPSTIFMISPMLLFMNCSASQPAIPPTMMAAIQPTPASPMAHLLAKAHGASLLVAPNKWLMIDLHQILLQGSMRRAVRG